MKNSKKRALLTLIGFSLTLSYTGCSMKSPSYRLGQFTAASSFNVRNLNYEFDKNTKVSVVGEDCFIVGQQPNTGRLQRAMDNAIKDGQNRGVDGDLLVNVRIDQQIKDKPNGFLGFPIPNNCIIVSGDLVKIKDKK